MAQAASASTGTTRTGARTGPADRRGGASGPGGAVPDVFGPRAHLAGKVALTVVLGLLFGFWAAANRRDGGPITGWNALFGWLAALAFIVVFTAVGLLASKLPRERRALLWAVFAGIATGFLISQSPHVSLLRSVIPALATAVGVFAVLFYRSYASEAGAETETEGHRRI
ncbi:hypothetical protein [Streptomyces ziwulingensis]|uniref:Integral membrane protein n=1 Tax=Streptomyces ziwulingensis TaxID=1045501 RepID=A0ABP9BJI0_9ACTN